MKRLKERIVITGTGAICASGRSIADVWTSVRSGRSAVAPIRAWDAAGWPAPLAGEVPEYDPMSLVGDRKLHKLIGRTDILGLHAASRSIEAAGLLARRSALDSGTAAEWSDRTGVYVASGGVAYANQYDFFPLLTSSEGDLGEFGRHLADTVTPMWLLRTLPNNVLCHIGVRFGFKGPNACITTHGVSGILAIAEAAAALRSGEADRAVAVGHVCPVEPQNILYYHAAGLLAPDAVRPFDLRRQGTVLGEGAGAAILETAESAREQGADPLAEVLGSACVTEGEGIVSVRDDGDGPGRAMEAALEDAALRPADVGLIVAHGNGTRKSDASEARAILRVFGPEPPPVTAFKWAFGHLLDAAGVIETCLAAECLRSGVVPGIPTLEEIDPECGPLPAVREETSPRTDAALIHCRGFGGLSAAIVIRARRAASR